MHDYEILKYAGIILFGVCLIFFIPNALISFLGLGLIVFGMAKAVFHYTLHQHTRDAPRRINKMRPF